jgi:hypothetical protein
MSKQGFTSQHFTDENGAPEGGQTSGKGFTIAWQRGPLGREADRVAPNGAFVEDVLDALIDRLDYYQGSKFACTENRMAIAHLRSAAHALAERTSRREEEKTEGTHLGN